MKKISFKPFFKKSFIIILLLLLYVSFNAFSYASSISSNIANNVFRLHIIANSNSYEDQDLKYKVRDKIIEYMKQITINSASKEDAVAIANMHLDDFKSIAKNVVLENGYNYDVGVKIGSFSFPTKQYGDISLPAGIYDALEIEIGNASGQNWWCVMFPPLCFVDVSSGIVPDESKEVLKSNLHSEEYNIISKNDSEITFKFKLLELLGSAYSIFTAKK